MDLTLLSSSESFAKGYLYAVVLAISLKTSLEMANMEKFKYILEAPDSAGISLFILIH